MTIWYTIIRRVCFLSFHTIMKHIAVIDSSIEILWQLIHIITRYSFQALALYCTFICAFVCSHACHACHKKWAHVSWLWQLSAFKWHNERAKLDASYRYSLYEMCSDLYVITRLCVYTSRSVSWKALENILSWPNKGNVKQNLIFTLVDTSFESMECR